MKDEFHAVCDSDRDLQFSRFCQVCEVGLSVDPYVGIATPGGGYVGAEGERVAGDAVAQVVEVEAVALLGFCVGDGFDLCVASGLVVEDYFFGYGAPDFVSAFCEDGFKSFSELWMRAVFVGVDGFFQWTMAVIDDPAVLRLCMADVAEWVVFAEEWGVILFVQCRAVDPEERGVRTVEGVGQAHCAEVAVFATGVEDVVRHVGVVAGRAVEIDGCVNGGFEYVFGAADFQVNHVGLYEFMAIGVIANSPAPGEEVFEFVGVHVAIAIVAGVADVARFAQLPDDDFYMSRDAVFFVDGDCELVQVNKGFVICDGIDPGFVVFPWAYCEGHVFLQCQAENA